MLNLVKYGRDKLIHAHCHVINSHKLGRYTVQKLQAYVAYKEFTSQQVHVPWAREKLQHREKSLLGVFQNDSTGRSSADGDITNIKKKSRFLRGNI